MTLGKSFASVLESFLPQKPESSLRFNGYPKNRDHPLHSPELWLEGKQFSDGAEGLWRVHNTLYDFADFVKQHPGGEDWIRLTKGTDITEAFESHHISTAPEHLLTKYKVRAAKTPRNSPFVFEEDGFYRTLKRNVREIIHTIPDSPATKSKIFADLLLFSYFLTAGLSTYFNSFTLAILAGVILSTTAIAAHNFFHQKDNFRMYYFDFSLLSSRSWRVTHALSHHIYTNTVYDIEMVFSEPWLQYMPVRKHFFWRYLSWFYSPIVYLFGLHMFYIQMVIQAVVDNGKSLRWTSLLPFTVLALMCAIPNQTIPNCLLLFAVILFSASIHFTVVGVNAAHHHPDVFHDGDEPRKREGLDWGIHEMDAVMDRSDINWSHFLVLTNFGDHCLHHLFPTVDHGKLKYLYPVFERTCKEFGLEMKLGKQIDLVVGQYQQLARVEPKKLTTKQTS